MEEDYSEYWLQLGDIPLLKIHWKESLRWKIFPQIH